ncbi:FxLYD domain-containing protein, partial [Chenggangzhangella methanolivorans]
RPRLSAVAVAIGVVALGALAGARVEIVRLAPSLASLYEAFGLQVNVRGLAIRDVRSAEELVDGSPVLLVTGLVENVSAGELDVPRLRLAVTAGGERELYAWTTVAARPKLQPGETATFRARLASPPAEGQAIAVRFLARHDLMASLGH